MTVLGKKAPTFRTPSASAPAMAVHERVWERPDAGRQRVLVEPSWKPWGTYALLFSMGGVFISQLAVLATLGEAVHSRVFPIGPDWYLAPWTLLTSTLSHGGFVHILFNGLVLFFFGPHLERLVGTKPFVALFLAAGAVSGILQVLIDPGLALGASGAINMVLGALVLIMPNARILLYGIIPIRFWVATVAFALLDVLGFLGYGREGIGNVAHLAGLALGLWVGYRTKQDLARRGVRLQYD